MNFREWVHRAYRKTLGWIFYLLLPLALPVNFFSGYLYRRSPDFFQPYFALNKSILFFSLLFLFHSLLLVFYDVLFRCFVSRRNPAFHPPAFLFRFTENALQKTLASVGLATVFLYSGAGVVFFQESLASLVDPWMGRLRLMAFGDLLFWPAFSFSVLYFTVAFSRLFRRGFRFPV